MLQAIWAKGHQVLLYAEGDWTPHLESFAELPPASVVYHVDRGDLAETCRILKNRFCISGGFPNYLLAYGTPTEVRKKCDEVLQLAADQGGYIADASAIVQNDARVENVRAFTDFFREHGVYDSTAKENPPLPEPTPPHEPHDLPDFIAKPPCPPPGICVTWRDVSSEWPAVKGDAALVEQVWNNIETLAYTFIWHCLVSF